MGVKIVSTGSYVPEKVLTNFDLENMVETSDEWIVTRTGIRERRISEGETTADMAAAAAKEALKKKASPEEVDLIVLATATPDMFFPSTACIVQSRIGAFNSVCFDISAACSGFIYALYVADSIMKSQDVKKALVIGAERFSKIVDWTDRSTCILFGDGAGAVLLEKSSEEGIISFDIGADGRYGELLYVESVGSNADFPYFVKMKGNEVFKVAVRTLTESSMRAIEKAGLKPSDISLLVPHQANVRILRAVADRLGIPHERVFVNIDRYGNTSAASIPIALDEAVKSGSVKGGDYVLLTAFGGGFTWASCVFRM